MTCGIYKLTHRASGKIYVGQSENIEKRWKHHRLQKTGSRISNAINEFGWDAFDKEIIQECDRGELNKLEEKYIIELDSMCPDGYNSKGSFVNKGPKISAEGRARMSASKIGNTNTLGYKHRPESIEKMRLASTGRPGPWKGKTRSEEFKKQVSEKMKGVPKSRDTKLKMAEAQRERYKKRPVSEETRLKMSLAKRGKAPWNKKKVDEQPES